MTRPSPKPGRGQLDFDLQEFNLPQLQGLVARSGWTAPSELPSLSGAERIAIDHYRDLIRYFGDDDPGTRSMLQEILRVEEEHADDMHDLLVAHEGRPMLKDK